MQRQRVQQDPAVFFFIFGPSSPDSTAAAPQNMHMGTAGLIKHTGKKDLVRTEGSSADRAFSLAGTAALQTVDAARYMHKTAPPVSRIGENRGFDEFPVFQEYAADRATSGRTGPALPGNTGSLFVKTPPLFPHTVSPAYAEEKGKTKPEEDETEEDKPE
jgi:hypothetical protein